MSKIKVSKEIGKVLDNYTGSFDATLIDLVKRHCNGNLRDGEECLYEINPIELSLVIVNGHEVELTMVESYNERISYIKKEMALCDSNGAYAQSELYDIELATICDMNRDFNLGLTV